MNIFFLLGRRKGFIMLNLTQELQEKLNKATETGEIVYTPEGDYVVGALFIPSNVHFHISEKTHLFGSQKIEDYPEIETRIAGIDMNWPAAILNVIDAENVLITGQGTIDGQGAIWWEKFWGKDEESGMMSDYINQGLRWAVDYDCKRPRNINVYRSKNIKLLDFNSIQSGFWNTQITYSSKVVIDGISVRNSKGPSTDGIDIDSSENVLVKNTYVECNDDNICIKAGRGKEAFENQTTCSKIRIENCQFGSGSGITIGSETSGGIEDVEIKHITFKNTGVGFRIKSANNRGGFIRNIKINGLEMENVKFPFLLQTNWYPAYSYAEIPGNYQGEVPVYWEKLLRGVTDSLGLTDVNTIEITDVKAKSTSSLRSRAFFIEGNPEQPIKNLSLKNISIEAYEYGKISGVTDLAFNNVVVSASEETLSENDTYER